MCYCIAHRLELKYFHFAVVSTIFAQCSWSSWLTSSENWELEIVDRSQSSRSKYGWMVSNTLDNYFQRQIAKKIFESKIEACPVNAGLCMGSIAFKHYLSVVLIWLKTLVAVDSESCQKLFPSFCAWPSEVTVLFNGNLSRRPFLGQVSDWDLLLCTGLDKEHVDLFLCPMFTQRPMRMIERLSQAMRSALVGNKFSPTPLKISFQMKKKVTRHGQKFTKH